MLSVNLSYVTYRPGPQRTHMRLLPSSAVLHSRQRRSAPSRSRRACGPAGLTRRDTRTLRASLQGRNRSHHGGPKKMDAVNAELKAVGVYNAIEQKQVTAWLGIRNSAAHGDYGHYDEAAVKGLIEGVSNFAVKYPA